MRVEFAIGIDEMVTAWFSGKTWWSWSPSQGARTNGGRENVRHGKGPGEVMVSPTRLTNSLDFELRGPVTMLSRAAYKLRARPITRGDFDLHSIGSGADEYEFVVDAQRGFLLRAEARYASETFRILEMTEVLVDADLPAGVFTPQAPEGEQFEYIQSSRRLSLEQLPAAVPFEVFLPTPPPGRVVLVRVTYADPRRNRPLSATIFYRVSSSGGPQANLWISESAEPGRQSLVPSPGETWRQVDEFMVNTDDSMGYLRCKVFLKRHGTHIGLESTGMPVHDLIGLARSLVVLKAGMPPDDLGLSNVSPDAK